MLGIADYGAFCAAILVFLALPGPGTMALLGSTARAGFKGGAAATLGLVAGDQVLLWLAVAGVSALLAAHPLAFGIIQQAGAIYLVFVGLRLLLGRARQGAAVAAIAPGREARQAFFITLLNPKAIVFYMAFFPLFVDRETHRGALTFAAMAATIATLTVVYCLALSAIASRMSGRMTTQSRPQRWLQRGAGALLLVFGVRMAV